MRPKSLAGVRVVAGDTGGMSEENLLASRSVENQGCGVRATGIGPGPSPELLAGVSVEGSQPTRAVVRVLTITGNHHRPVGEDRGAGSTVVRQLAEMRVDRLVPPHPTVSVDRRQDGAEEREHRPPIGHRRRRGEGVEPVCCFQRLAGHRCPPEELTTCGIDRDDQPLDAVALVDCCGEEDSAAGDDR